jgi:hypothetical protein
MHRDPSENVPRGTWNDDIASGTPADPGRSVSGPYRDGTETVRARRARLERELDEVDAILARDAKEARAIARAASHGGALGARFATGMLWTFRSLYVLAPIAWIAVLMFHAFTLASTSVTRVAPGILRIGPDERVVTREVVDAILGERAGSVLLEPVVEEDAVVGLRIVTLPWMRELGLRRGDVIVSVDDDRIAAPDGARRAFDTLRIRDRFDLVVMREGETIRLRYDLLGGSARGSETRAAADHAGARSVEQLQQRTIHADTPGHALHDASDLGAVAPHDDRRYVAKPDVFGEARRGLGPVYADEADRERPGFRARRFE